MSGSRLYGPALTEYLEVLKRHNEEEILSYLQANFERIQEDVGGTGTNNPNIQAIHHSVPDYYSMLYLDMHNAIFANAVWELHSSNPDFFTEFIKQDKPILVEILLRRGFNPNCPDGSRKLPLEVAIQKKNIPILKLLLDSPFIEVPDTMLEKASKSPEMLALLQERKNNPPPPLQKKPVYLYQGHGAEVCDPATGKLINKPVPDGSLYILSGICGSLTSINFDNILQMMKDKYDIILQNPIRFKKEIESALSKPNYEASIVIYSPGMEFVDNNFYPGSIWKYPGQIRIRNSGILEKTQIERREIHPKDKYLQTPLPDFNELLPFFEGSIYPTQQEIQDRLATINPQPVWTFEEVNGFFSNMMRPASQLVNEHPGIHFNLLCRSLTIKDKSCTKAILARRISSVEERGRNIIQTLKQVYKYDDLDTFKQFLIENYDAIAPRLTPRNIQLLEGRNTQNMATKEYKIRFINFMNDKPVFLRVILYDDFKRSSVKSFVDFLRENKTILLPILNEALFNSFSQYLRSQLTLENTKKYLFLRYLVEDNPLIYELKYLYVFGSLIDMQRFIILNIQELRQTFTQKMFEDLSQIGTDLEKEKKEREIKAYILQDPEVLANIKKRHANAMAKLSAMRFSPGLPKPQNQAQGGRRKKTHKKSKNQKKRTHKIRIKKV